MLHRSMPSHIGTVQHVATTRIHEIAGKGCVSLRPGTYTPVNRALKGPPVCIPCRGQERLLDRRQLAVICRQTSVTPMSETRFNPALHSS